LKSARLVDVHKEYMLGTTRVPALRGVSLAIEPGEFVAVAGPSGSGKSTLLNLVGCLDHPTSGQVYVGDVDVATLDDDALSDLRARTIGFIFQTFNLIPVLSALENVEFPLLFQGAVKDSRARAEKALGAVGLNGLGRHRPDELSGGQRQRVAVARALATDPAIVLADEPTANLDSATGEAIISLMLEINRKQGTTFLFSTHDPRVMVHASRVIRLADGRIETPLPSR
jgi:putative ABC transport system ATP-binding protein